ncbi:hypothetical protein Clacol_004516 [Clathrus columnatus]|uniref:FAD-binding PCMH-type domain-containing protein n=1 Tax=Clathrus columnatus TaxID=1419009 RepID=A0AAV5A7N6_9AGAM|nr:hypothetical protein Clacol_004516 [Clathrus columnatus]
MGAILSRLLIPDKSNGLTTHQVKSLKVLSESGIKGNIKKIGTIKYDLATIPWNLRCTPKPLAVVYPRNAEEVSTIVKIATKHGIPVQPRSGGHSYGSYSLGGKDGAFVVDLEKMSTVVVDQKTWLATIGGGTRLGEVTKGLYDQGRRTIAHGTCPQVGIGGHATVGGQGPLSRMYGLTLDHIVDMEVVLADGTITEASKETNPDLFFALRGAGASFGIVTSFTFRTHPAPTVTTHYSFQLKYGTHVELANYFLKWQEFVSSTAVANDRSFNSIINITSSFILVQGSRLGSKAELEASEIFISIKKAFAVDIKTHELDWLGSLFSWATTTLENLAGAISIPLYMKSFCVRRNKLLTKDAVYAWFDYMYNHSPKGSLWMVLGDLEAGRISDYPTDATAYSLRDAMYNLCAYSISGKLPFPDDAIAFMNGMINTVSDKMPDGKFGVYPGYVDPLIPSTQWPKQYWGDNYPRLLQIKAKYDPHNTFSNPQSVGADQTEPPAPAFQIKMESEGSKPVLNL